MKKLFKTTLIAFIIYKIFDFIIHGAILAKGYEQFQTAYRSNMTEYMWVFFVGPLIIIALLSILYKNTQTEKRCTFTLIMPFVIMIPAAFYTYASIDISLGFTLAWFGLGLIQVFLTLLVISKILGGCTWKKDKK